MSTSSSECEFERNPQNVTYSEPGQMCPAFLQYPLVYYTQIQPSHDWQPARKPEKGTPNCFVKAFRWYTQERKQNMAVEKMESQGFATWLDKKYNQFLQETHIKDARVASIHTPTNKPPNEMDCTPCATTKFPRVKSPWKKRRKRDVSEKCDILLKTSQSLEFILPPKDLPCPVSEHCQRTLSAFRYRSNTTMCGNLVTKDIPKSKSKTTLKKKLDHRNTEPVLLTYFKNISDSSKDTSQTIRVQNNNKSVICQCFKQDAQTQYDSFIGDTSFGHDCFRADNGFKSNKQDDNITSMILQEQTTRKNRMYKPCNCAIKRDDEVGVSIQQQEDNVRCMCPQKSPPFDVRTNNDMATSISKNTTSFVEHVTAQTSDVPININNFDRPLFVKIVKHSKRK